MSAGSPFNRARRERRPDGVLVMVLEIFHGPWRLWRRTPLPEVA